MTTSWNGEQFQYFIQLRDAFRSAKRNRDYLRVLSIGLSILELDKSASFLQITTPIFQTGMADACTKLGDTTSAIEYLSAAKAGYEKRKRNPSDWQKDIDMINSKLAKLGASL